MRLHRILGNHEHAALRAVPLFNTQATAALCQTVAASLPPGQSLIARAGQSVARLCMALAPNARTIWIACGPGNNGADGLQAALALHRWGKEVLLSGWTADFALQPMRATGQAAAPQGAAITPETMAIGNLLAQARDLGIALLSQPPDGFDVCIDALFGIGKLRPWNAYCAQVINHINASQRPTLAVDVPSGLDADTGQTQSTHVRATHTLSLLTLKPGLFTADGREVSGEIWFDPLCESGPDAPTAGAQPPACALLNPRPSPAHRPHNSHKGTFGDVAIVGGAQGMTGAALLAARAALQAGAGRVLVHLLHGNADVPFDANHPEIMFKPWEQLALAHLSVVAGCGGAQAIATVLEALVRQARYLVLDADALNHIALSPPLQALVRQRPASRTIITPHPLEAARLLGISTAQVQAQRLVCAQTLAAQFQCTVVLKGSGTVIAASDRLPHINTTGNAQLATAGTGDVLAGLLGSLLHAHGHAFDAACEGVYRHGDTADHWTQPQNLSASSLIEHLR